MKTTLSIASLLLGISLTAAEYHVTTTGDNAKAGTPDKPLKTISAAAQPGDIVTGLRQPDIEVPQAQREAAWS